MESATHDKTRNREIQTPTLRYNHPKNYFGVAIAAAAGGPTGALVQSHIVRGAGAAKRGAREFGLITEDGELTARGWAVAEHAVEEYGDQMAALERFDDWRGTSRRFVELDDGAWADSAPKLVAGHPVVRDVVDILADNGERLRLPELAHTYLNRWPEAARSSLLKGDAGEEGPPADRLYEQDAYRSPVTCQFKTILYHCGILTETGSDSAHLIPQTDVWELEVDVPAYVLDPEAADNGGDGA